VNLLAARVVLRPRSLADVLDLAVPFCLANRRPLGVLSLVVLGPIAALAGYLRLRVHLEWNLVWLVVAGASFLLEGIFTVAVGELMFREAREVRVRAVLGRFARRLPAYLLMSVVRDLVMAVSAVLLVPPFFLGPLVMFMPEALLLEGASPWKAFARSRALARNWMFACLGLWLATLALPLVGALVLDLVGNTVVGFVLQLGQPLGDLTSHGGSGFAVAGALLAVPVAAAARFLGYIDLRTRKEGWDIQLRFVALAEQGGPARRRVA
jgi:hypothetical protein